MSVERIRLRLEPLGADFTRAPGSATRAWASRDGVVLEASAHGEVGYGEASPLEGVSVETSVDARDALRALGDGVDVELGEPGTIPTTGRGLPPSARFALETALLDLRARLAGTSVAAWLAAPGSPATEVETQMLMDRLDGVGALECAVEVGARAVKVKIGRRGRMREEIALLEDIRRISPELRIRADANGQVLAPEILEVLVRIGCDLLEDPCPLEELGSRTWPVPIALDEPLYADPEAAFQALAERHAVAIVLKPTLVGGVASTLALAERARSLGVRSIVSHALESPIGLTACAHLALVVAGKGGRGEVHGLGRWEGLERFELGGRAVPVPPFVQAARIRLPESPGLGFSPRGVAAE